MNDLELIKANIMEADFPQFEDAFIEALLKKHESVPYVSYKLALMKAGTDNITLGPITTSTDKDFWNNLANMFLKEWEQEEAEKAAEKAGLSGTSGVKLMRRLDGQ